MLSLYLSSSILFPCSSSVNCSISSSLFMYSSTTWQGKKKTLALTQIQQRTKLFKFLHKSKYDLKMPIVLHCTDPINMFLLHTANVISILWEGRRESRHGRVSGQPKYSFCKEKARNTVFLSRNLFKILIDSDSGI